MLVTGGSRGIGAATARLAAGRGWPVALNYLQDAGAADLVLQDVRAAGVTGAALQADVADEAQVARLFEAASEALGGLDAVVINAGIVAEKSTLAEMSLSRIERMVRVNLLGALLTAREAARRLPRGGTAASIVFVSSVAARVGSPGQYVDYAASKGAVDTLTLGLAKELAPRGIRVNGVRPGLIETEIHASGGEPDRAWRLASQVPMARPGTADEVAEAILWLASEQASYVTGSILDVAGGR